MNLSRGELYSRLGVNRVRFPQYVNFGLPLTPESEFGFRIRATSAEQGDARTIERFYYIRGHEVTEAELNEAVMKARDQWAVMQSGKQINPGIKVDGFDGVFPGVAFDYEEVDEGLRGA